MSHRLSIAIAEAADAHRHQVDRRGEPYILHPLRIMTAVRAAGYGEAFQIVAVLHDVLEDTYVPAIKLHEHFGKQIMTSLSHISRRYEPAEGAHMLDANGARQWGKPLETHAQYFERCIADPIARVVKYYDTLDNCDPKRYAPDVPYSRYLKSLQWFQDNGVPNAEDFHF